MVMGDLRRAPRLAVTLFSVLFVAFALVPASAQAAMERKVPSRAIGVAYDNSGSMYSEGDAAIPIDRWCNAKYGLEVIAAMLDRQDALAVWGMDSEGAKLTLSGSNPAADRVAQVHNKDLGYSERGTNVAAVRRALEHLEASDAEERYLVVTTDGEFNSDSDEGYWVGNAEHGGSTERASKTLTALIGEARSNGIATLVLAIGGDAQAVQPDEVGGVWVYKADSDSILSRMTEMANRIFGRAPLPQKYRSPNGDLTLDAPMGQLIVFAQGKDARVGALTAEGGKSYRPTQSVTVSYSDPPSFGDYYIKRTAVNESLHGQVAVFDEELPRGTYHLDVSGDRQAEVYYLLDVDVAMTLTDEYGQSHELTEEGGITAGTYRPSYELVDPHSHEALSSDLLNSARFSLQVENEGATSAVKEGETFDLAQGTASLAATVETQDGSRATLDSGALTIAPPPVPLEVTVEAKPQVDGANPTVYNLDGASSFVLRVTKEGGEPLAEEEWAATTLSAPAPEEQVGWLGLVRKNLVTKVRRGDEPGTFEVRLESPTNEVMETSCGEVGLRFVATTDLGKTKYRGAAEDSVGIGGPMPWDVVVYLKWLFIAIALAALLILWVLAWGVVGPHLYKNVRFGGTSVMGDALNDRLSMHDPKRVKHTFPRIYETRERFTWGVVGDPGSDGRPIVLRGKVFNRFTHLFYFESWDAWRSAGWELFDEKGRPVRQAGKGRRVLLRHSSVMRNGGNWIQFG